MSSSCEDVDADSCCKGVGKGVVATNIVGGEGDENAFVSSKFNSDEVGEVSSLQYW